MNHRRKHPRETGARSRSSDWRYPQTERGSSKRSTASTKRHAAEANEKMEDVFDNPLTDVL